MAPTSVTVFAAVPVLASTLLLVDFAPPGKRMPVLRLGDDEGRVTLMPADVYAARRLAHATQDLLRACEAAAPAPPDPGRTRLRSVTDQPEPDGDQGGAS